MTRPTIHGKIPLIPAHEIRTALGDALGRIRSEDRLTFTELGEMIGKSDDQAAKYVDGSSEMPVSTYYRCKALWNGRFTGAADKLLERHHSVDGMEAQTSILQCAVGLSRALEDGVLDDAEIRDNRNSLQRARDNIDALLGRLAPQGVVGSR